MIPTRYMRLLNLSTFVVMAMLVSVSWLTLDGPLTRLAAIGLCLIFGAVQGFGGRAVTSLRRVQLFFAVQTLIAVILVALSGGRDSFNFPFYVLSMQAMLMLPVRGAGVLVAGFYVLTGLLTLWHRGAGGAVSLIFNAAVYFFTGAFGYILRQVEGARQEQARLLAELQASQRQVQELAVFEERNRLARDLHDSAKQRAFALSAQLDAVRSLLWRDQAAAEVHLLRAEEVADNLRQELANLILQLRPPELELGGLPAALRRYAAEWSQQCSIAVDVQVSGERPLPAEVEQALFRIAQEALSNVARHSQAKLAQVGLIFGPGQVALTISDSGRGFDSGQARLGVGTRSMQERMAGLPNGRFRLESLPGQGTRVTAECSV